MLRVLPGTMTTKVMKERIARVKLPAFNNSGWDR
jgi:hypothetical protein